MLQSLIRCYDAMSPTEVFLSHSSEDHLMAQRLADVLTHHGVPVFYSPQDILGAQQWQNEILSALQRCDWFSCCSLLMR